MLGFLFLDITPLLPPSRPLPPTHIPSPPAFSLFSPSSSPSFTFLGLFKTTPMLSRMTLFNVFQILSEGKSINDVNQLWMQANLSASATGRAWPTWAGTGSW